MLTFKDICDFIKDELACFQSIEDFRVSLTDNGSLKIDLEVHELNYIADVLSIGRIDKYLYEKLQLNLPFGMELYIHINMKMISSLENLTVVMDLGKEC